MNKEKYIRTVLKNIKCSKNDKEKIKTDLESDIQIALENGETWEQIEKRLGTPFEYSLELNDEFGYPSKNKSKKNLIIGILIGVVTIIAIIVIAFNYFIPKTYPIDNSDIFKENEVKDRIELVIEYLNNDDFDSMKAISSKEMEPYISDEEIGKAMNSLGDVGEYKQIISQEYYEVTARGDTMAVCQVVTLYEKRSITYTISFDENMKLAGLYMK